MPDPLTDSARRRPRALALRADGRDLTYAELDALATATARRLAGVGVRPGDRVATTLPPGIDFTALLHAAPRLGAVFVPLNTRLTAGERAAQVDAAAPVLVVEKPLDGPQEPLPAHRFDPAAPHTIVFTSGTGGAPKPVVLTYANHLASARASVANLGTDAGDRWLSVLPPFHVGGLAILLRSAIYGTAAVVHEGFEPAAARASLESGEATLVSLVATQLARLLGAGLTAAPALRAALIGGGPVPPPLLERAAALGLPALQTYGMTETASQIATLPAGEALALGSAGRPLDGVELRADPVTGELLVRGPMVSAGAVSADGWLHTGDRGRVDADGLVWVDGRLGDLIVTGGENVAPEEVEATLLDHPAVADAGVAGVADPEWGEAVTAWVVERRPVPDDELLAHCRARLAGYKVPKRFVRMQSLPRTASGKLLRRALGGGGEAAPAAPAPRTGQRLRPRISR